MPDVPTAARFGWVRSYHVVFVFAAALTLLCQGLYVFKSPQVDWVHYQSYDVDAHRDYFEYIYYRQGKPLKYHRKYVWAHLPAFYRLNAVVAKAAQYLSGANIERAIQMGWFVEGLARVAALAFILLMLVRLFPQPWLVSLLLILVATSARVFFCCLNWNQEEYVFLFACAGLYLMVRAMQDGLSWGLCGCLGLSAALAFLFKVTGLIPLAALLFGLLILPREKARWHRKLGAVLLTGLLFCAVNYETLFKPDGRTRLHHTQSIFDQCRGKDLNRDDWVHQYLTFDWDVFTSLKPVTVKGTHFGQVSETTGMYVYTFELYHHFQCPRTWLNLVVLWSGTGLLLLLAARAATTLYELCRRRVRHIELYLFGLLAVSAAAMVWFSLGIYRGAIAHPEYVLFVYPAAVILIGQQLSALAARPWLHRVFLGVALVHLAANSVVVARVMQDMLIS